MRLWTRRERRRIVSVVFDGGIRFGGIFAPTSADLYRRQISGWREVWEVWAKGLPAIKQEELKRLTNICRDRQE